MLKKKKKNWLYMFWFNSVFGFKANLTQPKIYIYKINWSGSATHLLIVLSLDFCTAAVAVGFPPFVESRAQAAAGLYRVRLKAGQLICIHRFLAAKQPLRTTGGSLSSFKLFRRPRGHQMLNQHNCHTHHIICIYHIYI